jgi:hypothetical protein
MLVVWLSVSSASGRSPDRGNRHQRSVLAHTLTYRSHALLLFIPIAFGHIYRTKMTAPRVTIFVETEDILTTISVSQVRRQNGTTDCATMRRLSKDE